MTFRSELIREIYWVIGVVVGVVLIGWLMGGNLLSTKEVDIQLHDTYLVATPDILAGFYFYCRSILHLPYKIAI